jgi:antitoxin component of MazEF toxin-antitoxin module
MVQTFKTKIRRIGSSLGVLIPKKMIKQNKIKLGEEIEMSILKRQRLEVIEGLIGGPRFKRENSDRV